MRGKLYLGVSAGVVVAFVAALHCINNGQEAKWDAKVKMAEIEANAGNKKQANKTNAKAKKGSKK